MGEKPEFPARIGLLAGYGTFPLELAACLKQHDVCIHTVATRSEASEEIESLSDSVTWLHVGQLGSMIRTFQKADVQQVVFAGKVHKLHLFRNFRPDIMAIKTLAMLPDRRDDTLMNAISDALAKAGIEVMSQVKYAGEMLAGSGHLCGPKPSKDHLSDIKFGIPQARGIAALDIGQTVVVKNGAVLAVEAIEGTDAAIQRGGALGNGKAVVIKIAKPQQDMRFDVPAIGPDTMKAMHQSGCKVLAIEAKKTLILERLKTREIAKHHGISIFGISDDVDSL